MLNKNLYLIWPTGYYGTYLHWIIKKSNPKSANSTVDTPFTTEGSSHAHHKIPTHMSIEAHLVDLIKNRHPTGTIYPIGLVTNITYASNNFNWRKTFENVLFWIFRLEQEPVIINIYNENNVYHNKLAAINMFHKEHYEIEHYSNNDGYYVYRDENKIRARNYLFKNWQTYYPYHIKQVTVDTLDLFKKTNNENVELRRKWEGYEYDADLHLVTATGRYFYNIKISDFLEQDFIDKIELILRDSNLADFDFTHARNTHTEYLSRQRNYIDIVNKLYIQAQCLQYYPVTDKNILYSALALDTLVEINGKLPDGWEDKSLQEIVNSYDKRK